MLSSTRKRVNKKKKNTLFTCRLNSTCVDNLLFLHRLKPSTWIISRKSPLAQTRSFQSRQSTWTIRAPTSVRSTHSSSPSSDCTTIFQVAALTSLGIKATVASVGRGVLCCLMKPGCMCLTDGGFNLKSNLEWWHAVLQGCLLNQHGKIKQRRRILSAIAT